MVVVVVAHFAVEAAMQVAQVMSVVDLAKEKAIYHHYLHRPMIHSWIVSMPPPHLLQTRSNNTNTIAKRITTTPISGMRSSVKFTCVEILCISC